MRPGLQGALRQVPTERVCTEGGVPPLQGLRSWQSVRHLILLHHSRLLTWDTWRNSGRSHLLQDVHQGVRPMLLMWESRVQDIGPQETSRLHILSNSESSPRDLHLNTKTQFHSTTSKLQCWTPHVKQLATQEHNLTHQQRGCLKS